MSFTYGTAFTGIGGFDLGLDEAGGECLWQIEKDAACLAVLRYHWPHVLRIQNVYEAFKLRPATVFAFGSPCQDLSLAGDRAGLAGEQSRLFFEGWRICRETLPRFVIFENVFGLLSSREGRDFATVIAAFTGILPDVPVAGWGNAGFMRTARPECYSVAWRVFDAKHFGVPQRRRRLFLVASLGDGCCAEILFEPEAMSWDSRPGAPSEEEVAAAARGRAQSPTDLVVAFDSTQITNPDNRSDPQPGDPCHTLPATGHPPMVAFSCKDHGGDAAENVSPTLRAMSGERPNGGGQVAIAFNGRQDPVPSVESIGAVDCDGHSQQVAIGFQPSIARGKSAAVADESGTLTAESDLGYNAQHVAIIPIQEMGKRTGTDTQHGLGIGAEGDPSYTLMASAQHGVFDGWTVRRLTPTENERLQGFPDHWTLNGVNAKGKVVTIKDGPRYRMTGNAVCVNVVRWIGRRIARFL